MAHFYMIYLFTYLLIDFTEDIHCTLGPVPKRVTWDFSRKQKWREGVPTRWDRMCAFGGRLRSSAWLKCKQCA